MFQHQQRIVQNRHSRGFVDASTFHAHKAVFDHVDPTHAISSTNFIQLQNNFEWAAGFPINGHGDARLKINGDGFSLFRGVLRRDGHAKIDDLDSVNIEILEFAGFVADVQAILIATVGFGGRSFDRDVLFGTVVDHLGTSRKSIAKLFDAPGSDHLDVRIQRLRRELEATLVVALTSCSMSVCVCSDFSGHLEAYLGN